MHMTEFVTPAEYAEKIFAFTEEVPCEGERRPERFKKLMAENRGEAAAFSRFPLPEDGLERKNPLIVALGDSVTAGHFEFIGMPGGFPENMEPGQKIEIKGEVVDVRESFPDRFRNKLVELYGFTSVSVLNAGIAGDTVLGMEKRLERDVLSHRPDLILINAALNWMERCGSNAVYEETLEKIVRRCKEETEADIVLITPNLALPGPFDHPHSTLDERVEIIRKVAARQEVCLLDVYRVWEAYRDAGYPVKPLFANGGNHPSTAGHEVYARALMKLFR